MVALHDLDGAYLAVNKPYCNFLDRSRGAILGWDLAEILGAETAPQALENLARCLDAGKTLRVNTVFQVFGQRKQGYFSLSPVRDDTGKPRGVLVTGSSTGERRNMEKRLDHLTDLLQTVSRAAQILLSGEGDFDETVNMVLGMLGNVTNVDRVYVWSIHESPNPELNPEQHATQLSEWSPAAEPQQNSDICTNRPVSEAIPTWINTFRSGKCVNSLVLNMPQLEQEQLAPQGIISIMTAPIMFHGSCGGSSGSTTAIPNTSGPGKRKISCGPPEPWWGPRSITAG